MGGVSTLARSALGGLAGGLQTIAKGDYLPLVAMPDTVPRQASRLAQRLMPSASAGQALVVAGLYLVRPGLACFSRMGYRLSGPPVPHVQRFNIEDPR
ncbi:MAG: hypothetical protein GPOALKHO_000443 [Sodalis sp.]|uniref:hypothetical protein n=1 Tax=Sodalis sp. (in: enterobacteria) TaxID=1898979 RepID=UPI003872C921|nr:MAG: hypothetical protein GPOALKHO_000443 [Sodalis sp.]